MTVASGTRPASASVIGGGPAGLMAAEVLVTAGVAVDLYDAMPSVGRKFLLAGKGGLNLTHSEPFEAFVSRYGARAAEFEPLLRIFGAGQLRDWAEGLGVSTFVGSSGLVFPHDLKAAPLLRAWLHRLRVQGVRLHMRHRWTGFGPAQELRFSTPAGDIAVQPRAVVLALGGASWPQLGSDGRWVPLLRGQGVETADLAPSNCGFDVGWSAHFSERHAGEPLKGVALTYKGWHRAGECVVTSTGIEGSLVYAASAALREAIARDGQAMFELDLLPQRTAEWVRAELAHPRGPRSLSTHLKTRLGLSGVKAGLLWERVPKAVQGDPAAFASAIKAVPIRATSARPVAEAISSAGGVRFTSMDDRLMLHARPGTFCAGEMLDWEAPTGGYLMTGCMASGRAAGRGAAAWLAASAPVADPAS